MLRFDDSDVTTPTLPHADADSRLLSLPNVRPGLGARARLSMRRLRASLPQGRLLPEPVWQKRHAGIVVLLWAHVVGLAMFGVLMGHGLSSVAWVSVIAGAAVVAGLRTPSRKVRSGVASFGLVASSALFVYFWNGAIEGHFHFFFVIGVLTLYQDWFPFLLALVFVVVHHGLLGAIDPSAVYSHPSAVTHPWRWAFIHAAFVVATSIANLVTWRVNENLLREPLTGLPGRVVFIDRLAQSLAQLDRNPSTAAVLFVDLDRFKLINDSLGHAAGDQLLVAVAERLRRSLRGHDTVSRLGGDEFAILCQDTGGERAIVAVAERIAATVAEPVTIDGHEVQTTASIGIALASDPSGSPAKLMRDADVAMYRAKERGGGHFEVFDESMHARVMHRMETESALRLALRRDEFRLFYQPEVSLATGTIVAVEALIRWEHPGRGLLAPGEFISVAEDTGLIIPIGAWVIQEACMQARRWRLEFPDDPRLKMQVNLSARQLADPDLVRTIAGALAKSGIAASELDLELTESTMMGDIEWTVVSLQALKDLGLRLSVDDFGTGHSSFSYLKNLPVDTLKVDRSFVDKLGHTSTDSAIVASIVDLAHTLGLSVTAEGVEHEAQLENLKNIGCDTAQGFYLARPQPPEAITQLLMRQRTESPLGAIVEVRR
jgi:diguanylate cyclase (GGDEF)-like protein